MGARAVYWAAHHNRREIYVGTSTVKAIVGNKLAPALLDRYLARNGFDAQQTRQAEDPSRADNLYAPVDAHEDHGAHGDFDSRSSGHSPELWADLHRGALSAVVGGVAGLAGAFIFTTRRRSARHSAC